MATLVLTAVGTAIGGPLGGVLGTFLGGALDRVAFGSGRGGSARHGNVAVQSSAYGEPIPRLYGRLRVAGNLIWSPGIRERQVSGGGKGRPGASYAYSASFAVALAARRIGALGRIWADGKLLRDADGRFISAVTMRFYAGDELQEADPLIAAAEGLANAPAYRGIAYVVFEDLQLADYGNRIPNLSFEIIADAEAPDAGAIAADLMAAAGLAPPLRNGDFPRLLGYAALRAGDLAGQLDALLPLADLSFTTASALSAPLLLRSGIADVVQPLADADLGALAQPGSGERAVRAEDRRGAAGIVPDAIAIGFFDPARDYQLGLQRAVRRAPVRRCVQIDVPAALPAADAKALAARQIGTSLAQRCTAEVRLPWRYAALRVGDAITAGDDAAPWRIRSLAIEGLALRLGVERLPPASIALPQADPGRSVNANDLPNGATVLQLLDLPPLPGALLPTPRLWIAAAGAEPGWRSAEVELSSDDGESYAWLGTIASASVMGSAITQLPPGPAGMWDRRAQVEVALLNPAMWLDSRTPAAVLGGANLALLGDELVQFTDAEALGEGRFRLSGLLRGRRGTEAEIGRHEPGERFVLIDPARLMALDPPLDTLGRTLLLRAGHRSGALITSAEITPTGRALQPLAPVALRLAPAADGCVATWVRRSRGGFGWTDGTDAPLSEDSERYQIEVWHAGTLRRQAESTLPNWPYPAAMQAADGLAAGAAIELRVRQMSASVGAGSTAAATLLLP